MILLEAFLSPMDVGKLEVGKVLLRMKKAGVPIWVNRNLAQPLVSLGLIKGEDGFYTPVLGDLPMDLLEIPLPLDVYLRNRVNLDSYIQSRIRQTPPFIDMAHRCEQVFFHYKVMVGTCLACGRETSKLEYIKDVAGYEGSYCEICLRLKGYPWCREEVVSRVCEV